MPEALRQHYIKSMFNRFSYIIQMKSEDYGTIYDCSKKVVFVLKTVLFDLIIALVFITVHFNEVALIYRVIFGVLDPHICKYYLQYTNEIKLNSVIPQCVNSSVLLYLY